MELPSKLLEQILFSTRPETEEHMVFVMQNSTHEEYVSQPLQTNNEQFKEAVTFSTGYNGNFNVTNSNIKFCFLKSSKDEDSYLQIISTGAYEIESFHNEISRFFIDEGHYTETKYPFTFKPNFSTLGSIIGISTQGPVKTFVPEDSIRDLLGFNKTTIYEEYKLSPNLVDILSFDNIFLERYFAQGLINRGK